MIGEKAIAQFARRGDRFCYVCKLTLWFSTTLSTRFGVAIKASC
ncbi:hypothetical protein GXM_09227 [Nostoc sphaeroides CCNUC1]|uniref:Uncharacterized protein n=1 Tax=Nostoc sphaeroides CCNUC1 TaxID=2653204 RepID=A0A5P8WFV9_9NOSO|nr:hypothetical protein GXM_09227 [Nostoc sphaeroides CCNUC1]